VATVVRWTSRALRQQTPRFLGNRRARVDHLAHVRLALAPAVTGRRHEAFDQPPFGVGQITRITKAAPVGRAAVLGSPHGRALHHESTPDMESQPTHPTQVLLGSALTTPLRFHRFLLARPRQLFDIILSGKSQLQSGSNGPIMCELRDVIWTARCYLESVISLR